MIDISDGAALRPIYVDKGGFPKVSNYHSAYVDGFATIFSTTDLAYRATKAKVVAPLFSNTAVYRDRECLYQSVERFVQDFQNSIRGSKGRPVDLQKHTRALGLDVLTSYLFRHRPSRIQKQIQEGSMIPWLDLIVDLGRFFYFPSWLSRFCVPAWSRNRPQAQREANASQLVHEYTTSVARASEPKSNTFQGRLLKQGIAKEEIAAECKSMMVAGIHSFGSVLAMTLWNLARHPTVYDKLRVEILGTRDSKMDAERLPYLQCVIKEGLRFASANATRLPRAVPGSGWHFDGYYYPPGTVVGIAAHQLFFNPQVFAQPKVFLPERWLDVSLEMQRDLVPFSIGIRQCLAKNLATAELFAAVEKVVDFDLLKGAKPTEETIEIWEWFNAAVKGNTINLIWPNPESDVRPDDQKCYDG
ncbi:MAG: hypothetical protein Q9208_005656 [Pyrenodesmia sp. 3 TL-2023]